MTTTLWLPVDALRALLPCASQDETRWNLCTIHAQLDAVTRKLTLTATDGTVLGQVTRHYGHDEVSEAAVMISTRALKLALALCKGKSAPMELKVIEERKLVGPVEGTLKSTGSIYVGATVFGDAIVDGRYPDTKQIIKMARDDSHLEAKAIGWIDLAKLSLFTKLASLTPASKMRIEAPLRLQSSGPIGPAYIDFKPIEGEALGVIMPCRLD